MTAIFAEAHESGSETEFRSERDLERHVAMLDGVATTLISMRRENDDANLTIGGGPERFVVAWDRNGDPPYRTLLTKLQKPSRVDLVVGGQLSDFDPEVAVTPSEAMVAAGEFMRTGERTSALAWREE